MVVVILVVVVIVVVKYEQCFCRLFCVHGLWFSANISSFSPECRVEELLLSYCCRWRKPKREQLATRQYIDEYRASQASSADDNIVVYKGATGGGLPERSENSILQRISINSNKDPTGTKADQLSLLCCEDANNMSDVDVTSV